ncbi:MAG: hypothetical protein DI629_12330 [Mesorhizobium amorphae]|nr:MAG: hypothetical protein DI629_12330 [Mesorhizobium amorphae]
MVKAKADKPVYAFIRKGNALVPEMGCDARALDGIAQGERVKVDINQWRNLDRLRAYWAMLGDVIEATGQKISTKTLHEVIKLENGVVDVVQMPNGLKVQIPASIALDKLPEAEMVEFFRKAEAWLAETYGYEPEARAA